MNSQDEFDATTQSYFNRREAECIAELIEYLTQRASIQLSSIGIITPYRAQLTLLTDKTSRYLDIGNYRK